MRAHGVIFGLLLAMLVTMLAACDDGQSEPRGRVSKGPVEPDPAESADRGPKQRFLFDTGSALETMRATNAIRARLKAIGIDGSAAEIIGDEVQVDVPAEKAAAAKTALAGGRLDLFLADDSDVFDGEQHAERFTVASERVGDAEVHYLRAPAAQKDALRAYVTEHAQNKEPLLGPLYDKGALAGYRSWLAQSGQQARGEYLTSAKVEEGSAGVELVLTFEAAGKSFIHWTSKQGGRLLVEVDGEVIGAVQTKQVIKDGVLRVAIAARATAAETGEAARAIAASIDRRALGHATKLREEKALDGQ